VYICNVFTPKAAKNRWEKLQESVPLAFVGHHIWKRRISRALFLTFRNLRNFNLVKELCNDRRPWVCNQLVAYTFILFLGLMCIVTACLHIGVGSWLLVSTRWAISGPRNVERVTGKSPRFFCILGEVELNLMLNTIWRRSVCKK